MRVLITGGTGFIGSHLAQAHLERGDHVLSLDAASTAQVLDVRANPASAGRFPYVKGSVLDDTPQDQRTENFREPLAVAALERKPIRAGGAAESGAPA